jgi:deferrochelatase/peroxidase EfeB
VSDGPTVSRRAVLGGIGAAAVAGVGGFALGHRAAEADAAAIPTSEGLPAGAVVPFHGAHQAGIATPVQDRLIFGSFEVVTAERQELVSLLRTWTESAVALTRGDQVGSDNDDQDAPPDDTGEARGLPASRLTITFGFGPALFTVGGRDRFGLADQRPDALIDLPGFAGDQLDPGLSGGDLAVQVCADDPQVAYHALRNLTRQAKGTAVLRWSEVGFGRTSTTGGTAGTPRNLQGFKDGTNNVHGDDEATMTDHVWVRSTDGPSWIAGGSYLVTRRIRMFLETWDRSTLSDQEATIGRQKRNGAPLGGRVEHDQADLAARDGHGALVVPADAHIRLASHTTNAGARLLRRGYSFTDGVDPVTGQLDGGLFFIGYQRDPRSAFVPIQHRLAEHDALNEYIVHTGSAIFACPPGISPGGWIGETLF